MSGPNINNFLMGEKLFKPDTTKPEHNRRFHDPIKTTPSKSHHYHLLYSSLNKQSHNEQAIDRSHPLERNTQKIVIDQHVHSRSLDSEKDKNPNIRRKMMMSSYLQDQPTQQQESPSLEVMVTKSSRKYFDSCRAEGLEYIAKLQEILNKDFQFLQQSLNLIHSNIEQVHGQISDNIKEQLYRIVDLAVQKWKTQSLQKFHNDQMTYIGELYELNTQIDERYKQTQVFKEDLDNEKMWKNRASDLLTSSYEADFIQLSKLCKKSVEAARENISRYWENVKKDFSNRLEEKSKIEILRDQIHMIIKQQSPIKKEAKPVSAIGKGTIQASISQFDPNSEEKAGEDTTANKSVNRKIFNNFNSNNEEAGQIIVENRGKNSEVNNLKRPLEYETRGNTTKGPYDKVYSFGHEEN